MATTSDAEVVDTEERLAFVESRVTAMLAGAEDISNATQHAQPQATQLDLYAQASALLSFATAQACFSSFSKESGTGATEGNSDKRVLLPLIKTLSDISKKTENTLNTDDAASKILESVAPLWLHPKLTLAVVKLFRPVILDLAYRTLNGVCNKKVSLGETSSDSLECAETHGNKRVRLGADTAFGAPSGIATASLHELFCIALGKTIVFCPYISPVVSSYFAKMPWPLCQKNFFERDVYRLSNEASQSPSKRQRANFSDDENEYVELNGLLFPHVQCDLDALVLATYRIVANSPARIWKSFEISSLMTRNGQIDRSRLTSSSAAASAAHLIARVFGVQDACREEFFSNMLANDFEAQGLAKFFLLKEYEFHQLALKNISEAGSSSVGVRSVESPCSILLTTTALSSHVASVSSPSTGELLVFPRAFLQIDSCIESSTKSQPSRTLNLVGTYTTRQNIWNVARALCFERPILLAGPPACGKHSAVEFLASAIFLQKPNMSTLPLSSLPITKLQLTSDAKHHMLGSYVATSEPGKFVWARGPLTRAVQEGHWVLFENIEAAPLDALSLIAPLLESRTLHIAQRGETIVAHENFRIFATTCSSEVDSLTYNTNLSQGGPIEFSASLWTQVRFTAIPKNEVDDIVHTCFPRLYRISSHMVKCHFKLEEAIMTANFGTFSSGVSNLRPVSLQDLFKWFGRIETRLQTCSDLIRHFESENAVHDDAVARELLVCALDLYYASVPADCQQLRQRVLQILDAELAVGGPKAAFFAENYPFGCGLSQRDDFTVQVGRVSFPASQSSFVSTSASMKLLERLAFSVQLREPVLLVGETSAGKTFSVQHLASLSGRKLHAINLSQQSETSDLLGGFRPVAFDSHVCQLFNKFLELFSQTFAKSARNSFLGPICAAFKRKETNSVLNSISKVTQIALRGVRNRDEWVKLQEETHAATAFHTKSASNPQSSRLLLAFIEGVLVSALQNGEWVLLDEINLATPQTLEAITSLLEPNGTLLLSERGDERPVRRHPNFRVFACMNPATDVGKRNLAPALRSKFTEVYVDSPDVVSSDLLRIVTAMLAGHASANSQLANNVVAFYYAAKEAAANHWYDGAGARPVYSLRTLSRALAFATELCAKNQARNIPIRCALFEGLDMTFGTVLDAYSRDKMLKLLTENGMRSGYFSSQTAGTATPTGFVEVCGFLLQKGLEKNSKITRENSPVYVQSPSVKQKLQMLARAVSASKHPILIQGPTSCGKTSIIEHLAQLTQHKFVRINHHAHTDLQEYYGSYVTDSNTGKIHFQEGTLVQAIRDGHWVVLDELNLAPSDILESLNRLLDDNRELFLPETNTRVTPHPNFMLFATQNPPSYGGRKVLSRAFRNRFLELHFTDIPQSELEQIVSERCVVAPSVASRMVQVFQQLRTERLASRIFDDKSSVMSLRDLFKWATRSALTAQEFAENGWMVLGERARTTEERDLIMSILCKTFRATLDPRAMYSARCEKLALQLPSDIIVWNDAMKRLVALTSECVINNEPVLLIGETGCGKTTVCQALAAINKRTLSTVNCHQHSDASDFIGSQRPCRDDSKGPRLFDWHDGPLVQAMRNGEYFLMDEVSLADDSVLERLNSVLEPGRTLLISEKGGDAEVIVAAPEFRVFATMNPGGDYGKKELSPALRNRFTEIYTTQIESDEDIALILQNRLSSVINSDEGSNAYLIQGMLAFVRWLRNESIARYMRMEISIRDILAWAGFVHILHGKIGTSLAFYHGGCSVFCDGIKEKNFQAAARDQLMKQAGRNSCENNNVLQGTIINSVDYFGIDSFCVKKGTLPPSTPRYCLDAPTAKENIMRMLRAVQVPGKAVLLEGSPGVGKTSIFSALAAFAQRVIVRINLSEHTDILDLFGSDLPVEGGEAGTFAWRDGPFLAAMKRGDWVLLDELNLASQSVLEGLNACLDHRGTVYVPELDREFNKHCDFRVFAAQNPLDEGCGRRGLPKSFLNRFAVVHLDSLAMPDLFAVARSFYSENELPTNDLELMLHYNNEMHHRTMVEKSFATDGLPWEFNLRDVLRWLELRSAFPTATTMELLDVLYLQRMPLDSDKKAGLDLFVEAAKKYDIQASEVPMPRFEVLPNSTKVGFTETLRKSNALCPETDRLVVPSSILRPLQAVLASFGCSWMVMLKGPTQCGKTTIARQAAALCGKQLVEFSMHPGIDALELLGGFEQVDQQRCYERLMLYLETCARKVLANSSDSLTAKYIYEVQLLLERSEKDPCRWMETLEKSKSVFCNQTAGNLYQSYLRSADSAGKFEWADGILLDAVCNGKWVLLENANLCSPAVLDRLNPLFEANADRHLLLNERGMTSEGDFLVVRPHRDFRLIMTLNPKYGQLSRAMRNRGIEIALAADQWAHSESALSQLLFQAGNMSLQSLEECKSAFTAQQNMLHSQCLVARGVETTNCNIETDVQPNLPVFLNDSKLSLVSSILTFPLNGGLDNLEFESAMGQALSSSTAINHRDYLHQLLQNCEHKNKNKVTFALQLSRMLSCFDQFLATQDPAAVYAINKFAFLAREIDTVAAVSDLNGHNSAYKSILHGIITALCTGNEEELVFSDSRIVSFVKELLLCVKNMDFGSVSNWATMVETFGWMKMIAQNVLSAKAPSFNLLWAHCYHLIPTLASSSLFISLQAAAKKIVVPDCALELWNRLHPWTVRHGHLRQVTKNLAAMQCDKIPVNLQNLLIDALVFAHLSNTTDQNEVSSDIAKIAALIFLKNESDGYEDMNENILNIFAQEILEKRGAAKFDEIRKAWIWTIQTLEHLSKYRASADAENDAYCIKNDLESFAVAPTVGHALLVRLLNVVKGGESKARAWQQLYNSCRLNEIEYAFESRHLYESTLNLMNRLQKASLLDYNIVMQSVISNAADYLQYSSTLMCDKNMNEQRILSVRRRIMEETMSQSEAMCLPNSTYACAGQQWIEFGINALLCAIPRDPVDPAAPTQTLFNYLVCTTTELQRQINVAITMQKRDNDEDTNEIIKWLVARLEMASNSLARASAHLYNRPSDSNEDIERLFAELHGLRQRATSILQRVNSMSLSEILNAKESLFAFLSRTRATYVHFTDILEVVYMGLYDLLHGLALIAESKTESRTVAVEPSYPILPSLGLSLDRYQNTLNDRVAFLVRQIELTASLPCNSDSEKMLLLLDNLAASYTSFAEIKAKAALEEAAEFKFKPRTIHLSTEDVKLPFPWLTMYDNEENAGAPQSEIDVDSSEILDENGFAYRAMVAFLGEFGKNRTEFCNYAQTIANLLRDSNAVLPNYNDLLLASLEVSGAVSEQNKQQEARDNLRFNIYEESNVQQAGRLVPILRELAMTVESLLDEFPEHGSLLELRRWILNAAKLEVHTPLVRILQAVEALLEKCDDWERFAAKRVSIRRHMDSLSELVVAWRRMEVRGWGHVLEWFDIDSVKKTSSLWIHLYASLRHVSNLNLIDVVRAVDHYILSSTAGQYESRLLVLEKLAEVLKIDFVTNMARYYRGFANCVQKHISKEKSEIQRALKNIANIASWRDVNVRSLQASARKSHVQISKQLRKYRELVEFPVAQILTLKGETTFFGHITTPKRNILKHVSRNLPAMPIDDAGLAYLYNQPWWPDTYLFKANEAASKIKSMSRIKYRPTAQTENMSNRIIDTVKEMLSDSAAAIAKSAEEPVTATSVKGMAEVRKRVLVELIKAIRAAGVKLRASTKESLIDALATKAFPGVSELSHTSQLFGSADKYFLRVSSWLPHIIEKRSQDITQQAADRLYGVSRGLYTMLLKERRALTAFWNQCCELERHFAELCRFASEESSSLVYTPTVFQNEYQVANSLLLHLEYLVQLGHQGVQNRLTIIAAKAVLSDLQQIVEKMRELGKAVYEFGVTRSVLANWLRLHSVFSDQLNEILNDEPAEAVLATPILGLLALAQAPLISDLEYREIEAADNKSLIQPIEHCILQTKLCAQELYYFTKAEKDGSAGESENQPTLGNSHEALLRFLGKIKLSNLLRQVKSVAKISVVQVQRTCIRLLLPLLQSFFDYLTETTVSIAEHHKSLAKLCYVAFYNARQIVVRGFELPEPHSGKQNDSEESKNENESKANNNPDEGEGAGMGDGKGTKDVSDEIEDESQIEGTKNEEKEADEDEKNEDDEHPENERDQDGGLDVDMDFDGALEDIRFDGADNEESDDSHDEDLDDLDDAFDQVDNEDSNNLDQGLWDKNEEDDDEENQSDSEDQADEDGNNSREHEEEDGNREQDGAERPEGDAKEKKAKQNSDGDNNLDGAAGTDDENLSDCDDTGAQDASNTDSDKGDASDNDVDDNFSNESEVENDNVDMKNETQENDASDDDFEKTEMADDDTDCETKDSSESDEENVNGQDEKSENDAEETDVDEDSIAGQKESASADTAECDTDKNKKSNSGNAQNPTSEQDADSQENGKSGEVQNEKSAVDQSLEKKSEQETASGESQQMEGGEGLAPHQTQQQAAGADQPQNEVAQDNGANEAPASATDGANEADASEDQTNDARASQIADEGAALGDAAKHWRRKLEVLEKELAQRSAKDTQRSREHRFVQNDEDQEQQDTQMLATANDNANEAGESCVPLDYEMEKIPEAEDSGEQGAKEALKNLQDTRSDDSANEDDKGNSNFAARMLGEIAERERQSRGDSTGNPENGDAFNHGAQLFSPSRDEEKNEKNVEDSAENRNRILNRVDRWLQRGSAGNLDSSRQLWRAMCAITHQYSLQLVEQLRIILRPTVAAQLCGDFKSGKRINMRRILPYIASDFKKDKIWLRRAKESQRDYHVLLAIDDSESMRDSESVQLAFESACLITSALQQLEVGPVSVCSFGATVRTLVPFGERVGEETGARMFDAFRFDQKHTDIDNLLRTSVSLFGSGGSLSNGAVPWRLMLVVSDGRCSEHHRLRNLVRRAAEERIAIVCIVLDYDCTRMPTPSNATSQVVRTSILKTMTYDPTTGLRSYMDTFPFDYYIVLRDVRRLPIVLADALRQFFAVTAN